MLTPAVGSRNVIDSSVATLAYAFESAPGVLVSGTDWQSIPITGYEDFGSTIETFTPTEIKPGRMQPLGEVVGLSATGGFTCVVYQRNLRDFLPGFTFTPPYAYGQLKGSSAITAVAPTSITVSGATAAGFVKPTTADLLVRLSGFGNANDNKVVRVTAATNTSLTTTGLIATSSPPASATVDLVGYQMTGAGVSLDVTGSVTSLKGFVLPTGSKLRPGAWIRIGGKDVATQYSPATTGYARVGDISAAGVNLDITTFTPSSVAGKTGVQIFIPTHNYRNSRMDTYYYYQLERRLGTGSAGLQAEYVSGALANELTFNFPTAEVVNASVAFVARDAQTQTGSLKSTGSYLQALSERTYNTSAAIKYLNMYEHGAASSKSALFKFLSEMSLTVTNNVTSVPAVGSVSPIDVTAGDFNVTGSATAYFKEAAAIQAARDNVDVGLYAIANRANEGWVADIPHTRLGEVTLGVTANEPITVEMSSNAGESALGYMVSFDFFDYLPV